MADKSMEIVTSLTIGERMRFYIRIVSSVSFKYV